MQTMFISPSNWLQRSKNRSVLVGTRWNPCTGRGQSKDRPSSHLNTRHKEGDEHGTLCWGGWGILHGILDAFQKKTILQMIQNCSREVPTVFFVHKLMYVVGKKNHVHSAEINVEFEKNDFQKETCFHFPASIFAFLGVPARRKKKVRPLQGPLKGRYGTGVCSQAGPWRGWQPDQVGCTPNNRIAVGFLFGWERPFKTMQMVSLKVS